MTTNERKTQVLTRLKENIMKINRVWDGENELFKSISWSASIILGLILLPKYLMFIVFSLLCGQRIVYLYYKRQETKKDDFGV